MKRAGLAILWFFILSITTTLIGEEIAVRLLPKADSTLSEASSRNLSIARIARGEFVAEYGPFILVGSIIVSVIGTIGGALPGTKPRIRTVSQKPNSPNV
jgi:hypothetical protein